MPIRLCLTIASLCLLFAAVPARAMQFSQETVGATEVFLVARGPIVKGDGARLEKALAAIPATTRILAVALDSPGGIVVEGEQMATLIRARALAVVIAADRQCVSACFLMFAAAPRKIVESNALVGVHSASENGTENETTMAVSVQMARIASVLVSVQKHSIENKRIFEVQSRKPFGFHRKLASLRRYVSANFMKSPATIPDRLLGVPPAIVGKMVRTKPGSVEWLTPADLTRLDIRTSVFITCLGTVLPSQCRMG